MEEKENKLTLSKLYTSAAQNIDKMEGQSTN